LTRGGLKGKLKKNEKKREKRRARGYRKVEEGSTQEETKVKTCNGTPKREKKTLREVERGVFWGERQRTNQKRLTRKAVGV